MTRVSFPHPKEPAYEMQVQLAQSIQKMFEILLAHLGDFGPGQQKIPLLFKVLGQFFSAFQGILFFQGLFMRGLPFLCTGTFQACVNPGIMRSWK